MKSRLNTVARWTILMVLAAWMGMSVVLFLGELAEGCSASLWTLLASKVLAALSGWACVITARKLDGMGWLPNVEYFTTDEEGGEL